MEWTNIKIGNFSTRTIRQRNGQLNSIKAFLSIKGKKIDDPSIYSDPKLMDDILEFIKNYKGNTKVSYLDVFSSLVDHYNGNSILQKKILEFTADVKHNKKSGVVAQTIDENFIDHIKAKQETCPNRAIRILGGLIIHDMGGIRINDIINTRIHCPDDHIYSWIDTENAIWYIRDSFTKNRKERQFDITEDAIKFLNEHCRGSWVLCNKKLEPYNEANYLGELFKKTYGCNYGQVRKGVSDKANENATVQQASKHANRLGHTLKTELQHYVGSNPNTTTPNH